jgi:hypothetical protein
MRPILLATAAAALLLLSGSPLHAADVARGKALHEANCVQCHDTGVYTRRDRRIQSLEALNAQVQRCDAAIGLRLFPEELDALVQFLNETYYKFQ